MYINRFRFFSRKASSGDCYRLHMDALRAIVAAKALGLDGEAGIIETSNLLENDMRQSALDAIKSLSVRTGHK